MNVLVDIDCSSCLFCSTSYLGRILEAGCVALDLSPEITEGEGVDSVSVDAQTVVSAGLCIKRTSKG